MQSPTFLLFALFTAIAGSMLACDASSSDSSNAARTQPSPSLQPDREDLNAQMPKVQVPEIRQPEIRQPKIQIPEITIPEITIPGIRVQQNGNSTIITINSDILFDFDQHTLRPDAEAALRQISAAIAKRYPQNAMKIQGHTDSKGSNVYNQTLSERRATSVKQWLKQQGKVASAQMTTSGYGESQPVAPNTNPDGSDNPTGRQKNRRVEIVIQQSN
jgi:outer membrane protein OmpA-like peptidoglycan-associated protein